MKYLIIVFAIVVCVAVIAAYLSFQKAKNAAPTGFAATMAVQDTVFLVGKGYTGGMGSMPVLDTDGNIQLIDGLSVYIDETQVKSILEKGNLPTCVVGKPRIEVSAKIHLEKKQDMNSSIEDARTVSYYIVKIDELKNVNIDAEKCE